MSQTKHTPTPWKGSLLPERCLIWHDDGTDFHGRTREQGLVLEIPSDSAKAEADMDLILKAVNNHDALRKALSEAANTIAAMMRAYELPEECNGIIAGELDLMNAALEKSA